MMVDRGKQPSKRTDPEVLPSSQLREIFRHKLRYAVNMVGSINAACALIGVNRTQFNRYLSGQSMPRPELLYLFCQKLSLPMEWFFDPSQDFAAALSEHQIGVQLRDLVANNRFQIGEGFLPDGFYLMWKGMFDAAWPYEALLCRVTTVNKVKSLVVHILRRLKSVDKSANLNRDDFVLEMVMMRTANGIFMFSIEEESNHVRSFFIRSRAPGYAARGSMIFSGIGVSGAFGGRNSNSIVPILLLRVQPSVHAVLAAGRVVRGYEADDVPAPIKAILDEVEAPSFILK